MAVRRRYTSGTSGTTAPRVQVLGSTATDAFAARASYLNRQLQVLKDQEQFKLIADQKPEEALPYIEERLKAMAPDDPNRPLFEQLRKRIQATLEAQQWQDDIKAGTKTEEDLLEYLNTKFSSATQGTTDAQLLLRQIGDVKKSIVARNEMKQDQLALKSYLDTSDHLALAAYLTQKLMRTTDPRVQQTIAGQVADLKERARKEDILKVDTARAKIVSEFAKNHDATTAIQKLQDLLDKAKDPSVVNSIQSAITAVASKSESDKKSAASEAKKYGDAVAANRLNDQVRVDESAFMKAKKAFNDDPSKANLDRMELAAANLSQTYKAVADSKNSPSEIKTWEDRAVTILSEPEKQAQIADNRTLQGFDVSTNGVASFAGGLSKDPKERAEQLLNKLDELRRSQDRLLTAEGRRDSKKAMTSLDGLAKSAISDIGTGDSKLSQAEKDTLNLAYNAYEREMRAAGHDPVKEDVYMSAVRSAKTLEDLNKTIFVNAKGAPALDKDKSEMGYDDTGFSTLRAATTKEDQDRQIAAAVLNARLFEMNHPEWAPGGRLDESTRAILARQVYKPGEQDSSPDLYGGRPEALSGGMRTREEQEMNETVVGDPAVSTDGAAMPVDPNMGGPQLDPSSVPPYDPYGTGGVMDESRRAASIRDLLGQQTVDDSLYDAWERLESGFEFPLLVPQVPDLPSLPAFLPDYSSLYDSPDIEATTHRPVNPHRSMLDGEDDGAIVGGGGGSDAF